MTVQELGKALHQARIARGLTLHDVERDTRINRSYLQALEEGNLDIMPAPVYARAFLRTYAQYLGLDARPLLQQMPGARPEPDLPPLPEIRREVSTPVSGGWVVGAVVALIFLGIAAFLFWDRGGDEATVTSPPAVVQGQGAEQPVPPDDALAPPPVIEPGRVPDLRGQNILVAVDALRGTGLRYAVIEVESEGEPFLILRQEPAPGSEIDEDTVITLIVSR